MTLNDLLAIGTLEAVEHAERMHKQESGVRYQILYNGVWIEVKLEYCEYGSKIRTVDSTFDNLRAIAKVDCQYVVLEDGRCVTPAEALRCVQLFELNVPLCKYVDGKWVDSRITADDWHLVWVVKGVM